MAVQRHGGAVYASVDHLKDYVISHRFPAIHDDMAKAMLTIPPERRKGALDLGACYGLLACRAKDCGFATAIGWEADQKLVSTYLTMVPPHLRLATLMQYRIEVRSSSFSKSVAAMVKKGVNTVLARRAFPELFVDTYGPKANTPEGAALSGSLFSKALLSAGVEFLVIEGRQDRTNSTHVLHSVDQELVALGGGWLVNYREGNVAVLTPS